MTVVGCPEATKDLAYSEQTGKTGPLYNLKENEMSVKPIPEGYHSITPYLGIDKAAEAIEFYKKAFGAIQIMRLDMPDGKVGHAELRIGDSPIMLASPCDEMAFGSPGSHPTSVGLHLYVTDVDAQYKQAIAAGATVISEPKDQFYGDRSGTLKDPFGHVWFLATHIEELTEEQIRQRAKDLFP
ncbi:glyoxalase [Pseudomonas brenneri]|jgi:PhnB protein|uniref:PhnB protein n=2 Tax=Pseudomonas brenneri TaxID=129817 RepID=A0ABY0WCX0_9PSED|nr:glyoxalase [Pseudomonas brenneri]CRM19514.1 putative enzyme related to lactoylglutathione lyase [Pseudomonas sp. 25 R 14]SDU98080.1 PhnB protein [Pseudomonas brenneri]